MGQAFIPNEDEVDLTDTPMVTEDQAFISNEDEADLSDAPIMTEDEAFIQNQDEDLNLARPSTSSPEVATQEQPQKNESTSPTVTKVVEDRNLAGPSSKSSTFMDALKGNKYINAKMKNIKIYSEQEINSQKDTERQRRTFWNEKAEQLAKSPKTSNCSKTTIVGIIDVAWTLRKTTLIEAEARKLIQSEKELFDKEDLASGKKLGKQKQETLPSNLDRMAAAHSAVEAIDADMEGCQKKFKKGKSIQQRKNDTAEYKRQKALMDGAYTELKRAQEATIKSIKAKQQQLEIRLGEKKEDSEAEPE